MTGRAVAPEVLAALQAALAGEHAAGYGYGVVGAWLAGADRAAARAAYDAHVARRDRLQALLRDRGADPVAASPAYALPYPVGDAASARRLGLHLEEGTGAAYADLVAAAQGDLRRFAALALRDTALRALGWRGRTVPFPGLPERAASPSLSPTPPG